MVLFMTTELNKVYSHKGARLCPNPFSIEPSFSLGEFCHDQTIANHN